MDQFTHEPTEPLALERSQKQKNTGIFGIAAVAFVVVSAAVVVVATRSNDVSSGPATTTRSSTTSTGHYDSLTTLDNGGNVGPSTPTEADPIGLEADPKERLAIAASGKRDIELIRVRAGSRKVMFIGGIFGKTASDVAGGVSLVQRLPGEYARQANKSSPSLLAIPNANPDRAFNQGGTNSNGVYISRNFPSDDWSSTPVAGYSPGTNGTAPLSEPETQAVYNELLAEQPDLVVVLVARTGGAKIDYNGSQSAEDAEFLGREISTPTARSGSDIPPGSLGRWWGDVQNHRIVFLYLPKDLSGDEAWRRYGNSLMALVRRV